MNTNCKVVRKTTVSLNHDMKWNIKLDLGGGKPPFEPVELEDKIIDEVTVSQCKDYEQPGDDVVVVVFHLVPR